jgi:hypothetical protein
MRWLVRWLAMAAKALGLTIPPSILGRLGSGLDVC